MTLRAVILGLMGAAFVCAVTYFNDHVMMQTMLVGNSMPQSVYGGLILFLLLVNPTIAYLKRRWAFTGAELAVILVLTLAACSLPGSGLMRFMTNTLMQPHHQARTNPGWQHEGVIEMAPDFMLADISGGEHEALNDFVTGVPGNPTFVMPPWSAWARTLAFWAPLIPFLWIGAIGLAAAVHKQWSVHERLPYPISTFANSMLPGKGEAKGSVFRNRLFWLGAGVILLIHMVNYAHAWWPDHTVKIPTVFDFGSLAELFPTLGRGNAVWRIFTLRVFFTVIAVAYFVPSDVSLSLGVGATLWCYVSGLLIGYGVSVYGRDSAAPSVVNSLRAGTYIGMLVMILYTGRRYYFAVFRRALGFAAGGSAPRPSRERHGDSATVPPGNPDRRSAPPRGAAHSLMESPEEVEPYAVWGARVFLVCSAAFALTLSLAGLDWMFAIFFTVCAMGIFLVMGRVIAETGLFFIQTHWLPDVIILAFLGLRAVGPSTALILLLVSTVLLLDPREGIMPFVVNSFRLLEERKVRIGRPAVLAGVAVVLGLAVAVPATLGFQYANGTGGVDPFATKYAPRIPFDGTVRIKQRLRAQGALEDSESVSGLRRFTRAKPFGHAVTAFAAGLAVVILFAAARLRFPWWPLHPVLFVVWSTYAIGMFNFSSLVGWLIKSMVVKFGGNRAYQRLKPLMFGIIAGDILGGVIPSVVGAIYYLVTRERPPGFMVTPH